MARQKKYTKETLEAAVKEYFDSITREVDIEEMVPTGKLDRYGHPILKPRKVINKLGKVATRTEYLVPPTLGGLCIHLGIVNSTWTRWRDPKKYKSFKSIIEQVDERLIAWRKEQVVTRDKVTGLIWDLETNYGCGKQTDGPAKVELVMEEELDGYGV